MSAASMLADVQKYVGKQIKDCIDDIETVAARNRYAVLVLDPTFDPRSIDIDSSRLNVRTDDNSVVVSFSIG